MNSEQKLMPLFIAKTCSGRESYIEYLKQNIPNLIISFDNFKDNGFNDKAYQNFQKGLILAGDLATVQMEDDIILCNNFVEKITEEISKRPDNVIQFFSMRKADLEVGSRYELGSKFCMNQCFYLPKGMALELLNHSDIYLNSISEKEKLGSPYDLMMADYFKRNKIKYWNVVPNLVDHKICVSMIDKRRSSKRQSLTFKQ